MTKILLIFDNGEFAGIRASEDVEIQIVNNKSLCQFGLDDDVDKELEEKYPFKH